MWTVRSRIRTILKKIAALLRYSHGTDDEGFGATAMYFHGQGNMTTDQPLRAIEAGVISRYGTLDPTDGNLSERHSLSVHFATAGEEWKVRASAYYIASRMTLWNNFTHYLNDPVNGDQEQQNETRTTTGGQAAAVFNHMFGAIENDSEVGLQLRDDSAYVNRLHTQYRDGARVLFRGAG